jgi:hypothetical protein
MATQGIKRQANIKISPIENSITWNGACSGQLFQKNRWAASRVTCSGAIVSRKRAESATINYKMSKETNSTDDSKDDRLRLGGG